MTTKTPEDKVLIRFDGMCVLCSKTVKRLLKADRKKRFVFQAIQDLNENPGSDSVIVTKNGIEYQHLNALLIIGKELGGIYRLIDVFWILPPEQRTRIYLWIARNRYKWFGSRKSCFLPSPEEKDRFI
jgi:predicted DCC family thiol-disulfide oxidoreductase YuxK